MKKLILAALLFSSLMANSRVEYVTTYDYYEPAYVEELVYEPEYVEYEYLDPEYDYVEEVWEEEVPCYLNSRRPYYTEVVYEQPVTRCRTYSNPIANFFSGVAGFMLGTAFGSAVSR